MQVIIEGQQALKMICIAGLTGLITGYFLNVLIHRLPRGELAVKAGNRCRKCGHKLKTIDLIPVFSYIFLKGRCRYCAKKIPLTYPLVEVLTAASFVLVYIKWGITVNTLVGLIFTSLLIVSSFTDIQEGIIPDHLTYPGIIAGFILSFFTIGFKEASGGAFLLMSIYLAAALISGGGMGGGDIKLAGAIGTFTGPTGALMVFILSSIAGGTWALYLIASGRAGCKTPVKFGPFMSLAAWIVWMYGSEILKLYPYIWM